MGYIITIIILVLIIAYYMLRYYLLNKNLKKAVTQLDDINKDIEQNRILLITYPNKQAEAFLEKMNKYIELTRTERIWFGRREKELRAQIENISHDLRTPLTAIIGYLELLDTESMSADDKEMIEAIDKRARSLQILIGNFYDLSRLEMDDYHLQIEKMDLVRFTKETILLAYQELEQKNIQVQLVLDERVDSTILADIGAMERIFNNMIQNVLRYAKSYLRVSIISTGDHIELTFANDSDFINQEEIPHIFERFYVREKSRTSQSTGLGLTINKLLTEAMHATVDAKAISNELAITYHFNKA